MVNGWCTASQRFSSSSHSTSGKSTTQANASTLGSASSSRAASSRRSLPSAGGDDLRRVGHDQQQVAVAGRPAAPTIAAQLVGRHLLAEARADLIAARRRPGARPRAAPARRPAWRARSARRSAARVAAAARHADALDLRRRSRARRGTPRTRLSATHRRHVDAAPARSAGRACRSRSAPSPRRRSGAGTARSARLSRHDLADELDEQPLDQLQHVLLVDEVISMSSWVNSGWRSARRSSSRKQRAIWK